MDKVSSDDYSGIKQRLVEFASYKGFETEKWWDFESKCKITRRKIQNWMRGNTATPGAEVIFSIAMTFQDLNLDWLIRGNGSMLIDQEVSSTKMGELKKEIEELKASIKKKDMQIEILFDTLNEARK